MPPRIKPEIPLTKADLATGKLWIRLMLTDEARRKHRAAVVNHSFQPRLDSFLGVVDCFVQGISGRKTAGRLGIVSRAWLISRVMAEQQTGSSPSTGPRRLREGKSKV